MQARCIQPTRTLSAHKWYRDYLQKKLNINLPPKRPENLEMYTRNVTLFKMCEEESFHVNFSHIQMLSHQILFQLISKFSSIFSKTTFVDQKRLLSFDKRQTLQKPRCKILKLAQALSLCVCCIQKIVRTNFEINVGNANNIK